MTKKNMMPEYPESYWRETTDIPTFPKLKESLNVDVGIVGAGITGITTAYLLAKENLKVALLDSNVILSGTTGHTTAKITAQHGLIYDELLSHFGLEKTQLYYQANKQAKQFIKQMIDQYDLDCDYKEENAILYTNSDNYLSQLENEQRAYEKLNILHHTTPDIPLNIPIKSALIMENQAEFHPLKYLKKLVDECVEHGVQIYENTTAVDVEYNKHPTIISKDGHRITCRYVIAASHYPFYDGQGFYPTRLKPDRAYAIAVRTGKKYPGGMYINAESPTRSIRGTPIDKEEDLWIIAGENHKTGQGKSTIEHYLALQDFADKQFGIEEFVYRWSAQDLTTLDKLPYIGPITKEQHSVLVATGYRKWGMTNGTAGAHILADYVLERDNPYKEIYNPARFQADPSIKKFAQFNTNVAKHLIKGKFDDTVQNFNDLDKDEATITRINGQRTGVYKDNEAKLHMVDTTCTHLHCEVAWNSGERTWDCPCHGSRFKYTGEVIEGPAKEPLKKRHLDN